MLKQLLTTSRLDIVGGGHQPSIGLFKLRVGLALADMILLDSTTFDSEHFYKCETYEQNNCIHVIVHLTRAQPWHALSFRQLCNDNSFLIPSIPVSIGMHHIICALSAPNQHIQTLSHVHILDKWFILVNIYL